MPNASTNGIQYEISLSRLVLYPRKSCGINPIEVIVPAATPNQVNISTDIRELHLIKYINAF